MKSHQLINADSGSDEYYTPDEIISAARRTLGGGIDLDPASSPAANRRVRAGKFFTKKDDALNRHWLGKIWLNHPFGRDTNRPWIAKLAAEFSAGRVTEAVCITFAATSEKWFAPLLRQPQCFLSPRTNYFLPNGTLKRGVTKGSVVTYFGHHVDRFSAEFSKLGVIKIVHKSRNKSKPGTIS